MQIRAAIVFRNKEDKKSITSMLKSYSYRSTMYHEDVQWDFVYYQYLYQVLSGYKDLDIAFFSQAVLSEDMDILKELYLRNPNCLPILVQIPDYSVCQYLSLRPAGYLNTITNQEQLDSLCYECVRSMSNGDSVLQLHTRQGDFALSISSISYCQSMQKYVLISMESGEIYRKIEKLDNLSSQLPEYFQRVHQSFLVNTRRVIGVDKTCWEIVLDTGNRIPVSRAYQKFVSDDFQKWMLKTQK